MKLQRIEYARLNARQNENFNLHKISAVRADYGFVTMRLSDDWRGADFIALYINGETVLRVQIKSRLAFQEKYRGKDIWIACSGRPRANLSWSTRRVSSVSRMPKRPRFSWSTPRRSRAG